MAGTMSESNHRPTRAPILLLPLLALLVMGACTNGSSPRTLLRVTNVREVGFVTGESSPSLTSSRWSVGGTDLGVLFGDGPCYMAFGDTFSSSGSFSSGWRSNTLAVLSPGDPSQGLLFDRMITGSNLAYAKELVPSLKRDGEEITVVPTGGFQLGTVLYLHFMSVRHWGDNGAPWTCNYGGLWKSRDGGQTWTALETLRWPGDSDFVQATPLVVGERVYFWCIPAGRSGGLSLMRVATDSVEDFEAYEYYQGRSPEGKDIYLTGAEAMYSAATVASGPVGEPSVIYNRWLGSYLLMYLREGWGIVARTASTPEGPFSESHFVVGYGTYPALYGGFMHPSMVAEGGRKIYFALSQWLPTYNVRWMEATLLAE